MIRLTLIRHGETTANAKNLCQGQQPGQLSETGVIQAKQLAQRMRNESIDVLYASDLKRAMDTAAKISAYHPELEIIPDPLLRERFMGSWEGMPFPPGWKWEYLPAGAETNEDLLNRAAVFIGKIRERHEGEQVVAVTHGGMIRAFRTLISGAPLSEFLSWKEAQNTAVSRFELHPDGNHKILETNNTDHLKIGERKPK